MGQEISSYTEWLQAIEVELKGRDPKRIIEKMYDETLSFRSLEDSLEKRITLNTWPSQFELHHQVNKITIDLEHFQNNHLATEYQVAFFLEKLYKTTDDNLTVLVSLDSRMFLNIAKIRAIRHFVEHFNEHQRRSVSLNLVTKPSLDEHTLYDPWVNILRNTAALYASIIGGANGYLMIPHDYLGTNGKCSELSKRIAENTFDVLTFESHLAHVRDPMAGSFSLESLTTKIVEKSWNLFLQDDVDYEELLQKSFKRYQTNILNQKIKKTGLTSFANPSETLQSLYGKKNLQEIKNVSSRSLYTLEQTRDKLTGKKVALIIDGVLSKLSARANFVTNFFEVAGLKVDEFHHYNLNFNDYDGIILCCMDQDYSAEKVAKIEHKHIFIAGKSEELQGKVVEVNVKSNFQNVFETLLGEDHE
jgi:hypothetical protein